MSVAADATLLLSASSFVSPIDSYADPRAKRAFEAVANAYCDGMSLIVPAPKWEVAHLPLFHQLWSQHESIIKLPDLELDDRMFDDVSARLALPFALYTEGQPDDVAEWVALQFSQPVVQIHMMMSDTETVIRAGTQIRDLMARSLMPKFVESVHRLQREKRLSLPAEYEHLEGSPELPSFVHTCAAYAFSVAIRGYPYALGVGKLPASPAYKHHWLRAFVLRSLKELELAATPEAQTHSIQWGRLLTRALESGALPRETNAVIQALECIRGRRAQFASALASADGGREPIAVRGAIDDRETLLLDVLREAGVVLRYADTTRTAKLTEWLRSLVSEASPIWRVPVELITANLQPRWVRKLETDLRLNFRRDTFWDIFDNLKIPDEAKPPTPPAARGRRQKKPPR